EQLGGGGAEQADNGVGGERADEVEVEGSPGGVGGIGCVAEASVGDAAVGVAGVQIERVIPAGANEEPGAQVGQRLGVHGEIAAFGGDEDGGAVGIAPASADLDVGIGRRGEGEGFPKLRPPVVK